MFNVMIDNRDKIARRINSRGFNPTLSIHIKRLLWDMWKDERWDVTWELRLQAQIFDIMNGKLALAS
jgi:hypothetical protein